MASKISAMSREELQLFVDSSDSFVDMLKKLGLRSAGGNHKLLKDRLLKENINLTELYLRARQTQNTKGLLKSTPIPLETILTKQSTYNRGNLKVRLLREGLLTEVCSNCKLPSMWNGKRLVLILDHINGTHDDNRLENLRLLCPNCNSQTDTFAGRNIKNKGSNKRHYYCGCGNTKSKKSKICATCAKGNSKIAWPSLKELHALVEELGYLQTGKVLGVSDVAVRNRYLKLKRLEEEEAPKN